MRAARLHFPQPKKNHNILCFPQLPAVYRLWSALEQVLAWLLFVAVFFLFTPRGQSQQIPSVNVNGQMMYAPDKPFENIQVRTVNGAINAKLFCSNPLVPDATCIENAVAAAGAGQQVYVPSGAYSGTSSTLNRSGISLVLDPGASLNYALTVSGSGFYRSKTVSSAGAYAAGTTTFSGNFAGYSGVVLIEQVNSTSDNQIGIEFATVSSASSSQLVISSGSRFSYSTPKISMVANAIQASGTTAANSLTVSGNFTAALSVGDLVRVENTTGTDSPTAVSAYFEVERVAAITTSAVTFEGVIHEQMGNPWLVKMATISGLTVKGQGGFIQTLIVSDTYDQNISDLYTGKFVSERNYAFRNVNLRGAPNAPAAYDFIWDSHGTIANVMASDSVSSTDNGGFKTNGLIETAISGVHSYFGTASAQGNYPFMLDFSFTPYSVWNANDAISSIVAGAPNSGTAAYLAGLRGTTITSLTSAAAIECLTSDSTIGSGWYSPMGLVLRSGSGYQLNNFRVDNISIGDDSGVSNSSFSNFVLTAVHSVYDTTTGVVWIRGGASNLRFDSGEFLPSTQHSINFNDASETGIWLNGIHDSVPGGGYSIIANGAAYYVGASNRLSGIITNPATGPAITASSINGPAAAPSGACTSIGWVFSQDGHSTFCNGTAWVSKI